MTHMQPNGRQAVALLHPNGGTINAGSHTPTAPSPTTPPPAEGDKDKTTMSVGADKPPIKPISYAGNVFNLPLLFEILSYCRGHGSVGEKAFINQVLIPRLRATPYDFTFVGPNHNEDMLNIVVTVPFSDTNKKDLSPKTMFSCHIDTMHMSSSQKVRQKLLLDTTLEHVFVSKEERECLGADDGAGVWILLEMIRFKIPGTYVFHRGEERGCIGSRWMAENRKDWLKSFDRAIAFDRKDTDDVITFQRSCQTASNTFAEALAKALNAANPENLSFKPSPNGMYTDTANYTECISECTNLSIGYQEAHSSNECLNYDHTQQLLLGCLQIDWEELPKVREAKPKTYGGTHSNWGSGHHGHAGHGYRGGLYGTWGDDDGDDGFSVAGASRQQQSFQPTRSDATGTSSSQASTASAANASSAASASAGSQPSTTQSRTSSAGKSDEPYRYIPVDINELLLCSRDDLYEFIMNESPDGIIDALGDVLEEVVSLRGRLEFRRKFRP